MPDRLPEKEPQVSTRVHYLIRKGLLRIPAAEHVEIIHFKREMEGVLKFLIRLYVLSLQRSCFSEAAYVLGYVRMAQESDFEQLFERVGFPDEIEPYPETREWLTIAQACGCRVSLPLSLVRLLDAHSNVETPESFSGASSNAVAGREYAAESADYEGRETQVLWSADPVELTEWRKVLQVGRDDSGFRETGHSHMCS